MFDSSGDRCVGFNCFFDVINSSYYLLVNRLIDEDYLIFVDLNYINVNSIWRELVGDIFDWFGYL